MLPYLVAVAMFAVIALYVVIAPLYFYSVDKSACKYTYAIEREKSKKSFFDGLVSLVCYTALLLFISIAVELASR